MTFDYLAQPKEQLIRCNLCGQREPWTGEAQMDRYGFPVRVTTCCGCGLVYLNPRMTAEAYRRFYESGAYRRLVSAFHGRRIDAETIQAEQREYGRALASFLAPHVADPMTILDIGGSTGVVPRELAVKYGARCWIVDPAANETREAWGMNVIPGTAESFDPKGRIWDLITLCQTVDHLLDIAGTLKKLRGCLAGGGLLFVDIVDYDVTRQIKIDHPYNLTEQTMADFLKRAGFREVARDRAPDGVHVRFLCER